MQNTNNIVIDIKRMPETKSQQPNIPRNFIKSNFTAENIYYFKTFYSTFEIKKINNKKKYLIFITGMKKYVENIKANCIMYVHLFFYPHVHHIYIGVTKIKKTRLV